MGFQSWPGKLNSMLSTIGSLLQMWINSMKVDTRRGDTLGLKESHFGMVWQSYYGGYKEGNI